MGREVATRRRGKALEEAIYQAVWDELKDGGFARLSMEGVAKRAGTSKPVLYRRWSNRVEMLAATALRFLPDTQTIPDAGGLRGNTVSVLELMRTRMYALGRATMVGLLAEIAREPEENAFIQETFLGYMRKIMLELVIDRAIAAGEITSSQVTERLAVLPIDLARMEFILTGRLPDSSIEEIVDTVFIPALHARPR